MRTLIFILVGMSIGACLSLLLAALLITVIPMILGSGGDEMSQGIMGTLIVAITAPLFGLIGAAIGFRKSQ